MLNFSWPLWAALAAVLIIATAASLLLRRRPKGLNKEDFNRRWHELQSLLPDKKTWPLAIINADKLVDDALKRRRFKGKTMGERLVAAQHELTANDRVWYAHKLRNKLVHENYKVTRKGDIKEALLGFLQALKDLGAM